MSDKDVKDHHKMIDKVQKEENNKGKIAYQVLTWGPCVVKLKITDEFFKILTEECTAAVKEENLYQHRLAGIIKKEYQLKDLTRLQPYIDEFINVYDQIWDRWRNAQTPSKNKYIIKALWVNYQRQHEFNPPHDHSDDLSFVTYLKIPEEIKKEYLNYKGKSSGPGGISFIYGEGNRQAITYQAYFPEEKDLFIFPAWLKHYVAPFQSDVERISVSGNIACNIPFNAIKEVDPKVNVKVDDKDKA